MWIADSKLGEALENYRPRLDEASFYRGNEDFAEILPNIFWQRHLHNLKWHQPTESFFEHIDRSNSDHFHSVGYLLLKAQFDLDNASFERLFGEISEESIAGYKSWLLASAIHNLQFDQTNQRQVVQLEQTHKYLEMLFGHEMSKTPTAFSEAIQAIYLKDSTDSQHFFYRQVSYGDLLNWGVSATVVEIVQKLEPVSVSDASNWSHFASDEIISKIKIAEQMAQLEPSYLQALPIHQREPIRLKAQENLDYLSKRAGIYPEPQELLESISSSNLRITRLPGTKKFLNPDSEAVYRVGNKISFNFNDLAVMRQRFGKSQDSIHGPRNIFTPEPIQLEELIQLNEEISHYDRAVVGCFLANILCELDGIEFLDLKLKSGLLLQKASESINVKELGLFRLGLGTLEIDYWAKLAVLNWRRLLEYISNELETGEADWGDNVDGVQNYLNLLSTEELFCLFHLAGADDSDDAYGLIPKLILIAIEGKSRSLEKDAEYVDEESDSARFAVVETDVATWDQLDGNQRLSRAADIRREIMRQMGMESGS